MKFGLSSIEAKVYMVLDCENSMTGYEVAKRLGISRSNIYAALASLIDKGGAYLEEGETNKYFRVPIEEFCNNYIRDIKKAKMELIENIPEKKSKINGFITIRGEKKVFNKIITMIEEAQERIYLYIEHEYLTQIESYLLEAIKRKIKVNIITDKHVDVQGSVYNITKIDKNQIGIIVDSSVVMIGELEGEKSTTLYSCNSKFVFLFKKALKNEIILSDLRKEDDIKAILN